MLAPALPVVALLAAAPLALSQTAPALKHSAPWLGKTLTLELEGLEPDAPYSLWLAAHDASIPTPYGQLELDLATAKPLAQGLASPAGTATRQFAIPADASFAEGEVHLQAATLSPTTGALALSNGAHLRLLGSRVHASQEQVLEYLGPKSRRLAVYGATDLGLLYSIELPVSVYAVAPVLSPNAATAAMRVGLETWRFDYYTGEGRTTSALTWPTGWLPAPTGDGWIVYASATPPPALAYELFHLPYDPELSPTPLGVAGEPGSLIPADDGSSAWLPATDTPQGAPRYSRFNLATGALLARVVVGEPDETVQWIIAAGERLIVGTQTDGDEPSEWKAFLNWVDTQSAPGVLNRAALGSDASALMAKVEASGVLLARTVHFPSGLPSAGQLLAIDPSSPASYAKGTDSIDGGSFVDLGDTLWLRENCCGTTDFPLPAMVWNVDPVTAQLVDPPTPGLPGPVVVPPYSQFQSFTATDDFTGRQLLLGHNRLLEWPWVDAEESFLRIDPVTGAQTLVPVGFWATWHLDSVSVP